MSHKKAAGSAENLKDSKAKYRGLKLSGGQIAKAGNIILKQKGNQYIPGDNVYQGKDFTLHAAVDGVVAFRRKNVLRFDGRKYPRTVVSVQSA
jgi:large subunit ribosomal protein L27